MYLKSCFQISQSKRSQSIGILHLFISMEIHDEEIIGTQKKQWPQSSLSAQYESNGLFISLRKHFVPMGP